MEFFYGLKTENKGELNLKNTISGFNQSKLLEYGLDLKDAMLLRYFVDFRDTESMSMIIVDNKPYYWLNYKHMKEDIPLIGISSNDALRNRFKKLEKCKVLGHYHKLEGGSYSYYCLGENYPNLIKTNSDDKDFNNYDTADKKTEGYKLKSATLPIEISTPTDKNRQQNNLSTKDSNYIYSANEIEIIWKMYPNKKGRAQAIKKIPKIVKKIGKEQMIRCIKRYSKEVVGKEKQYILNGSTFFNGRYEDYLDWNYECKSSEVPIQQDKVKEKFKIKVQEDM